MQKDTITLSKWFDSWSTEKVSDTELHLRETNHNYLELLLELALDGEVVLALQPSLEFSLRREVDVCTSLFVIRDTKNHIRSKWSEQECAVA